MTDSYIYPEPDEVTAYRDSRGDLHETRDKAIEASVKRDLDIAVCALCDRYPMAFGDLPARPSTRLVLEMAIRYPDLLRQVHESCDSGF